MAFASHPIRGTRPYDLLGCSAVLQRFFFHPAFRFDGSWSLAYLLGQVGLPHLFAFLGIGRSFSIIRFH